jgi:hypothetical protein
LLSEAGFHLFCCFFVKGIIGPFVTAGILLSDGVVPGAGALDVLTTEGAIAELFIDFAELGDALEALDTLS